MSRFEIGILFRRGENIIKDGLKKGKGKNGGRWGGGEIGRERMNQVLVVDR